MIEIRTVVSRGLRTPALVENRVPVAASGRRDKARIATGARFCRGRFHRSGRFAIPRNLTDILPQYRPPIFGHRARQRSITAEW
ncbi:MULTISPECIES: hypothetical protein [unclassified Streptomyces]|uniref:hypothetical protein n=1 Tax=unclassified Streptomyces TaxID=2593676 RepID=UPI002DD7C034|nr:hypothetical protein [Streptomyces sp. NBC_01750]WSA98326.1 hypothetical protein OIE54_03115 [Streptomyces sp. NBC_01794]WSD37136.1 hypothetical protein OG966_37665 [Streptomyces sp. NBC_01750]